MDPLAPVPPLRLRTRDLSVGVRPRGRPKVQRRARRPGPRTRREHRRKHPRAGRAPERRGVEVVTDAETYHADRVVVASDMWTNEVLRGTGVQIPLTITQEQVTYYATPYLREFAPGRFPVFMWHGADNFYGFPVYGEVATKLGQHMGGHEITPETRTFEPDPVRLERYRDFLGKHIPGFLGPELYTRTCPYTIPPDQNFVLDTLPEHPQISVAIGAGHAFKFASLIGRILSELALEGSSSYPVEPFGTHAPGHHRPYVREDLSRVMAGSSTSASREADRRAAPCNSGPTEDRRRFRRTVGPSGRRTPCWSEAWTSNGSAGIGFARSRQRCEPATWAPFS